MSNETKEKQTTQKECLCQNEFFRKILANTIGTFFGVFFALSLFCALHKPPVMTMPMFAPHQFHQCMFKHHHFDHDKFMEKKFSPKEFHLQKEHFEQQNVDKD